MKNFKFEFIDFAATAIVVITLMTFVFTMASCSGDDEPVAISQQPSEDNPLPLVFTATVDGDDVTRGTASDTWAANDLVAVSVGNGDAKQYKISTAAASSSMSGNGASNTFWWTKAGQTKEVRAWVYGGTSTYYKTSCTAAYTLPTDQSAIATIQNYDFLYASKSFTYAADATYSLAFHHQLAKVTVHIKYSNDANSTNYPVTAVSMQGSIYPTGTFTKPNLAVTHGTWTASGTTGNVTPGKWGTAATNYSYSYSALFIPQTLASSTSIKVAMTVTNLGTLTYDTGLKTLSPGNHYVYNITINKEGYVTAASSITGWSNSSTNSTIYYK